MKKINYCIMCEIEGKKKEGRYVIKEDTVGGVAHVCQEHYCKWKELEELRIEYNGNIDTED